MTSVVLIQNSHLIGRKLKVKHIDILLNTLLCLRFGYWNRSALNLQNKGKFQQITRWIFFLMVEQKVHTKYRRTTCGDVLLYFLPIARTFSSKIKFGVLSCGFGRPSGENAATAIPRSLQNSINFLWFNAGENSTWFTTGLMVHPFSMCVICSLLKFERPMLRTNPFSTNFSIALYVSNMSRSSLRKWMKRN